MCIRDSVNYGTVLYQLNPPEEAVREMTEIFRPVSYTHLFGHKPLFLLEALFPLKAE